MVCTTSNARLEGGMWQNLLVLHTGSTYNCPRYQYYTLQCHGARWRACNPSLAIRGLLFGRFQADAGPWRKLGWDIPSLPVSSKGSSFSYYSLLPPAWILLVWRNMSIFVWRLTWESYEVLVCLAISGATFSAEKQLLDYYWSLNTPSDSVIIALFSKSGDRVWFGWRLPRLSWKSDLNLHLPLWQPI